MDFQLMRVSKHLDSQERNLPAAISLSPGLRLVQTDSSYIALSDIYDEHCESMGITREDPVLVAGEKIKQVVRDFRKLNGKMVSALSLF
jgi:transformation/transcription domain-associated protein